MTDEPTHSYHRDSEISRVLDQYLDDLQHGRACSRQQLIAAHPDIADELLEYLDGIEMVAGLGVGTDLVPRQLDDFQIAEPIGQGAMGIVYRANQISLKRTVALKVLRYAVSGEQATKRFEREAELVATLDHPNIVPVFAFGQHESLHYFAMQLIRGESLSQWTANIAATGPTTNNVAAGRDAVRIARWMAQVARALGHAHQRSVIHRDIKPSNLLKEPNPASTDQEEQSCEKIWLTDFGLARRFDDVRMSMTGAMLGTPNYMSPEQAAAGRQALDHRTDIYSLGATLFELLTGRSVFIADTPHAVLAQVLTEDAPLLSDIRPDISRDLETIVLKCLEKQPAAR
ncbi:MAG: serine/threonine-protein kinase, partial [Planctomycetota bacterium]